VASGGRCDSVEITLYQSSVGFAEECSQITVQLKPVLGGRVVPLRWLRLALKVIVRFSLGQVPKPVAPIKPVRSLVFQGYRQPDSLAALVSLTDDVTQDSATDLAILMRRLNLYLAYFDEPSLIQYLDHAHALPVNLDDGDMPTGPALAGVTSVTRLIPIPEGRDEELSVDGSP
jgi:hypothetical protein